MAAGGGRSGALALAARAGRNRSKAGTASDRFRSNDPGGQEVPAVDEEMQQPLVLFGAGPGTLTLLGADSGDAVRGLSGHTGQVLAMAADWPSLRALTCGGDACVFLWDLQTGQGEQLRPPGGCFPSCMRAISADWSEGGRALTGSDSGALMLWDIAGRRCKRILDVRFGLVASLAVDWNKMRALVGHGDSGLDLICMQACTPMRRYTGHTCLVTAVAVAWSKALALCGSGDGALLVWEMRQMTPERFLRGHKGSITAVVANWAAMQAVTGSEDHHVRMWALRTGDCLRVLTGHSSPVRSLAADWDTSCVASGGDAGGVLLWQLREGGGPQTLLSDAAADGQAPAVCALAVRGATARRVVAVAPAEPEAAAPAEPE